MKNIKRILSFALAFVLIFGLTACAKDKTESTPSTAYSAVDMSVAVMTGPTGIGMAKLIADSKAGTTANNYTFTVAAAADEFKEKFLKGEIQIASVPTNLAATLYNATGGKVRVLAVNTNGVLSILQNGGTPITSLSDLRGKTLYAAGKGSNPEYILRHILEKNGLKIGEDINVIFDEATVINQKLIKGEAEFAMLPEPAASTVMTKSQNLKKVISINDEWSKVSDTALMMGCVVALDSYVTVNTAAVEKFLEEYKASIEFAKANVDAAAQYCTDAGITAAVPIAKKAIPDSNLCFITANDMKTGLENFYAVLYAANAKLVGGKLPADDFYYKAN
ncbi:MAG: ABC transporter substrate-binding protein [Ruminococcaceae bacterium]|nr:ABC transporter substrate-binding protein [Oscillospiraceae bacterium]